mmetsp:Transcript_22423/g.48716  ORF Transcript_22423/g.48716 Transcript_22423/m.48716 type:complete len:547 (+) Transcript_22423:99-1739(+)
MRYGPEDFGYTFVAPSDDAADVEAGGGGGSDDDAPATDAAATAEDEDDQSAKKGGQKSLVRPDDDPLRRSSRAADDSSKPYIYTPPKRRRAVARGGTVPAGDDTGGSDALPAVIGSSGACCCCICAALIVAGGTMLAYERFSRPDDAQGSVSNGGLALAGVIVLILAAASFLIGCCSCCFGCASAFAYPPGGGGGALGGLGTSGEQYEDGHKEVKVQFRRLNDRYEKAADALDSVHLNVIGGMKEVREAQKKEDAKRKEEEKKKREELEKRVQKDLEAGLTVANMRRNYRPVAFLIKFEGDMMASSMELLRKQVSIVVNCGRAGVDRAVVVVTSPGGAVSPYGLAASQLVRIRKAGIQLIVCVDTVAASGGYMMASVGDTVCAAPFAIIGSIGVITQIPNFQRFLNKHDIDAFVFTAGKHKRTVDVIGDVTEEGKDKLKSELEDMHRAFKDHVALARPKLKDRIEEVATGEYWVAVQAKELGLVDEIMTSDEYLESICSENEILEIIERKRKTPWSGFHAAARAVKSAVDGVTTKHVQSPHPMAVA